MTASPTAPFPAVVAGRRTVAAEVIELTLRRRDEASLPPWEPGAHIDLVLDAHTVRQYSLCGGPADRTEYRIAVQRESGGRGGSRRVHDELRVGDSVMLREPRNQFRLEPAPGYLFIAGGIGITPLLPMIEAARRGGRDWRLFYGGRSRSTMAYFPELGQLDQVSVVPCDEHGLLDLPSIVATGPRGWLIYCCGPEPLLQAAERECARLPTGTLRVERFTPRTFDTTVDEPFTVELVGSGLELEVPADRRLLDVLFDAGVHVMTSCEEGTCGTCETAVLAGEPDHRDVILTPEEQAANDRMMVCVSRCRSPRLVLDL
jgi:ferredoxin-NADP reductase